MLNLLEAGVQQTFAHGAPEKRRAAPHGVVRAKGRQNAAAGLLCHGAAVPRCCCAAAPRARALENATCSVREVGAERREAHSPRPNSRTIGRARGARHARSGTRMANATDDSYSM